MGQVRGNWSLPWDGIGNLMVRCWWWALQLKLRGSKNDRCVQGLGLLFPMKNNPWCLSPCKITGVPLPLPWSRSLFTTLTSFLVSMYFFLLYCEEKEKSLFLALLMTLFFPVSLLLNSLLCVPESWQDDPKVLLTDDKDVQPLGLIWMVLLLRKKVGWHLQTAYMSIHTFNRDLKDALLFLFLHNTMGKIFLARMHIHKYVKLLINMNKQNRGMIGNGFGVLQ